jgi:hydrogenase maturation protease
MPRTLLLGLGNPLLGDDGLGWKIAESVQHALAETQSLITNHQSLEIDFVSVGGLALMERMVGYDRAIVIDAVETGGPVGAVTCFDLSALPDHAAGHTAAPHDATLQTAVRLGRQLGAHLPACITIIGVEARNLYEFTETLTPEAQAVIPRATRLVLDLLEALS